MTRLYEAVYIFDSTLEDSAINDKLGRLHGLLGNPADLEVNHWGRRQLAYPIGRRENGYYAVAKFTADAATLPEYERAIKLDDGIIRHLITLYEHELGAPPMSEEELAMAARAPGGRGREDERQPDSS